MEKFDQIETRKTELREALLEYSKARLEDSEAESVEKVIELLEMEGNIFDNTFLPGHITGSAWVVSPDFSKVLLIHHKKLDKWLQPGGHSDGDPDTVEVTKREVQEETGYTPVEDQIILFDVDVHQLPFDEKRNVEPHLHYDLRYLIIVDPEAEGIQQVEEINDMKWVDINVVEELTTEAPLLRMARKTIKLKDERST